MHALEDLGALFDDWRLDGHCGLKESEVVSTRS